MLVPRRLVTAAALAAAAPAGASYENPVPITLPAKGQVVSTIQVPSTEEVVTGASVSLRRFTHAQPAEVDVLLVAPRGEQSMIMSDACPPLNETFLAFDDAARTELPRATPCDGALYRPTNRTGFPDVFPGLPDADRRASLGEFRATNPSGTWKLYLSDQIAQNGGTLGAGWTLALATRKPDLQFPTDIAERASPFPATRQVPPSDEVVADVDVTLDGVSHERPEDIELRLAGPGGEQVVLASDACGGDRLRFVRWTWDDEAARAMPADAGCPTGTWRPTDVNGDLDELPGVPPGTPAGELGVFDGVAPGGEWRLYAHDDMGDKTGSVLERFTIDVDTRPRAATRFATPAVTAPAGGSATLRVVRDVTSGGVAPATVRLAAGGGAVDVPSEVRFSRGQRVAEVPVTARSAGAVTVTLSDPTGDARLEGDPTATVTVAEQPPAVVAPPGLPSLVPRAVPARDRTAPLVRGIRFRRRDVRFTLSERASVTVRVLRWSGSRYVQVKRMRRRGRAGTNSVSLGRLRVGWYRVVIQATDAAGNRSRPSSKLFARRWG